MRRLGWLTLVALLALGCTPDGNGDGGGGSGGAGGGGGSDGGPPPNPDVDPEEITASLTTYYCSLIRECSIASADLNALRLLIDAGGDCEAFFARTFGELAEGLVAGESQIDVDAFERCQARSLEACVLVDEIPGCRQVVSGTRPAGAPCPDADVCGPGLFCDDSAPPAEGECNSFCAALRGEGEPCDFDSQCAEAPDRAAFCRYASPDDFEGTCATVGLRTGAAADAPCGFIDEEAGPVRVTCASGNYCTAEEPDESGTCQPVPAIGDPCADPSVPCDGGFCVAGTCAALVVGNNPGDPCDPAMLQLCNAFTGVICVDGTCVATDGSQGAPCEGEGGALPCQTGLYCADGTCEPRQADGEACITEDGYLTCASNYCAPDEGAGTGTCAPNPFDDDVCE